jgi:hypothetical protein
MNTCFNQSPVNRLRHLLIMVLVLGWGISSVAAISVQINGSVEGWTLSPVGPNTNSSAIKLNVSSDAPAWTVSVKDALDHDNLDAAKNSSSAGKMLEYNETSGSWIDTGKVLSANMSVSGEALTGIVSHTVQLGPQPLYIEEGTGATSGWKEMAITLNQPVSLDDTHLTNGNVYRVVITFIGTETGG